MRRQAISFITMFVVFDTNSYITLTSKPSLEKCREEIRRIKELEKKHGITALMSTVVASELLKHIYDGNRFYPEGNYTKGIITQYAHCGDTISYGLVPVPEVQIAHDFFNKEFTQGIETQKNLAQICYEFFANPTEETLKKHEVNIRRNKEYVEEVEEGMKKLHLGLADEWKKDKRSRDEKQILVRDMMAFSLIDSIANVIGKNAPRTYDYDRMVDFYKRELNCISSSIMLP